MNRFISGGLSKTRITLRIGEIDAFDFCQLYQRLLEKRPGRRSGFSQHVVNVRVFWLRILALRTVLLEVRQLDQQLADVSGTLARELR